MFNWSIFTNRLLIAFFILFLAGTPANANQKKVCAPPESFIEEIYNCGENKVAVDYAKRCAKSLKTNAAKIGKELSEAMAKLQPKSEKGQSQSQLEAMSRLDMAIDSLDQVISDMQEKTAIVATYSKAMIDFPDAVDEESSAECFNSAFRDLQDVVNDLDNEIIRSKAAHEEALKLADLASQREASFSSSWLVPVADSAPPSSQEGERKPGSQPITKEPLPKSKITGIEEDKKKRSEE